MKAGTRFFFFTCPFPALDSYPNFSVQPCLYGVLKSKPSCEHPEALGIFSSDLNLKLFSQALQCLLFLAARQKVETAHGKML